ncbi:MAG: SDR family NAD(P)-dependent oxidoreductase [Rhodospirillales bacterium]
MKRILITGAGRRVGQALALRFGERGWQVLVHCHQSKSEATATADRINAAGPGKAQVVEADLATPEGIPQLMEACRLEAPLDCVINNASLFEYDSPRNPNPELMRRCLNVNLISPSLIAASFYGQLEADGRNGCLINILDNKVQALNPDFYSYSLSKAAFAAASEMMAMAYGERLRVNGIAPGITLISGKQTEESFHHAHGMNPLGRSSTLEDLVKAADFIVDTPSLNGQILTIDGGQTLLRLPRDVAFLTKGAGFP